MCLKCRIDKDQFERHPDASTALESNVRAMELMITLMGHVAIRDYVRPTPEIGVRALRSTTSGTPGYTPVSAICCPWGWTLRRAGHRPVYNYAHADCLNGDWEFDPYLPTDTATPPRCTRCAKEVEVENV